MDFCSLGERGQRCQNCLENSRDSSREYPLKDYNYVVGKPHPRCVFWGSRELVCSYPPVFQRCYQIIRNFHSNFKLNFCFRNLQQCLGWSRRTLGRFCHTFYRGQLWFWRCRFPSPKGHFNFFCYVLDLQTPHIDQFDN